MAPPDLDPIAAPRARCAACNGELAYEPQPERLQCSVCGRPQALPATEPATVDLAWRHHRTRDATWHTVTAILPFQERAAAAAARLATALRSAGVTAAASTLAPVFVPWFVLRLGGTAQYSGRRGTAHTHTRTLRGLRTPSGQALTQRSTEYRWMPASGAVRVAPADLCLRASDALPAALLARLGDWPLAALRPFDPLRQDGVPALPVARGLDAAWQDASAAVHGRLEQAARTALGGDAQEVTSLTVALTDATFQLVLLPVWHGSFTWRGRQHAVLLAGAGPGLAMDLPDTPRARRQRWLAGLAVGTVLAVAYAGWMLLNGYDLGDLVALPLLVASLFGTFLGTLWLMPRVPYAVLVLLYLLAVTLVTLGAWWLTGRDALAGTVAAVLLVLGVLVLGAAWPGRDRDGAPPPAR